MLENHTLQMPGQVFGGKDSLERLPELLRHYRPSKVALFTDKGVQGAGVADGPIRMIEEAAECVIFSDLPPEPKAQEAEEITRRFAEGGYDLIVALGGGSVLDVAKLASVSRPEEYSIKDLLKNPELAKKRVPSIMIPTTAGTGSEATANAIVTVPELELKVGIVSREMVADAVILDASTTAKLPRHIAASTGIDALAHAVECYTGNKANPFSDLFALQAARLIFGSIEDACNHPENEEARNNMLIGSFYAGVAITASGTTAVHALAYPLGGKYHIPHGVSNAMLLAPVMAVNEEACGRSLCELYDAVGSGVHTDPAQKSRWVIGRIAEIVKNLDIPSDLKKYGIGADDLNILTDSAFEVKRLLSNNRRELTKPEIRAIYETLM